MRAKRKPEPTKQGRAKDLIMATVTLLVLWLLIYTLLALQNPPSVTTAPVPESEFSSDRAKQHLQSLTSPRPLGSVEHSRIEEVILAQLTRMGLTPDVQEATAARVRRNTDVTAGTVRNILTVLKGTDSSRAVLLMGHYDSVASGPGVSDDGSAVAILLETARALRARAPLKNDIILLFTDAEELGLLGASAFIQEHPLAREVGVVLNFEARGTSGPSIMFETTRQNGWLIRELARVAPHPVANSLSYEIYKRLPNDTDLSAFKQAGLAGFNFAFIETAEYYHTGLDTLDRLDERSLQQQGAYALALASHFGQLTIENTEQADAVYFNLPGGLLIHYSMTWALPLALLALSLFLLVVVVGLRGGRLNLKQVGIAALALLVSLVIALVAVNLLWRILQSVQGEARAAMSSLYHGRQFLLALASLTVAFFAVAHGLIGKRLGSENLLAGSALLWLVLALATAILLPGGSYLMTWPLIFFLAGLAVAFRRPAAEINSPRLVALSLLSALPALALLVPLLYLMAVAMSFAALPALVIMIGLLMGMLFPAIAALMRPYRWPIPGAALALALVLLIIAVRQVQFDRQHPLFNSLFYALNADAGKAVWATFDDAPDPWTSPFLSTSRVSEPLDNYLPSPFDTPLKSTAPALNLAAPLATVVADRAENGARTLRLNIKSPRLAPTISVKVETSDRLLAASINGKPVELPAANSETKTVWNMTYWAAPPTGFDLVLTVAASQPVKLRITDHSFGLPETGGVALEKRPEQMMAAPSLYGDFTAVSKSFSF